MKNNNEEFKEISIPIWALNEQQQFNFLKASKKNKKYAIKHYIEFGWLGIIKSFDFEVQENQVKVTNIQWVQFKFKHKDEAYTIFACLNADEGATKHLYEKIIIDTCWYDSKNKLNLYSFYHTNGSYCKSCPEEFIITKDELDIKIKEGSKLI